MKRFKFKLETLLDIRKRKEEEVKLELAKKNNEIQNARNEMSKLHNDLKELQASEKKNRATASNIIALRYSVAYRHKLKQDLLQKGRHIDDLSADAFEIRKRLVDATKNRRAIEIVKEKRFQEWKKEYTAQEQGFIDDVSQQGYIRKARSAQAGS